MKHDIARRAIVTGSRRGIGAAIARTLVSAGHDVVICARSDLSSVARQADELQAATGRLVVPFSGNLTNAADVADLHATALEAFGGVDILVNNAGGFLEAPAAIDTRIEDWQQQLDVNLSSPFRLIQQFLPGMIEQRWGRIVNIGSIVARSPAVGNPLGYVAAKAGLIGMSRQLALELADTGVTVNVVNPGTIATEHLNDYLDSAPVDTLQQLTQGIPMKRLGQAREVAGVIPYLVSDEAAFTTGASIDINGGSFMS